LLLFLLVKFGLARVLRVAVGLLLALSRGTAFRLSSAYDAAIALANARS
jgi:hypothetical protein